MKGAFISLPSIAQLVERWTVVGNKRASIGHWFESGSKEETFSYFKEHIDAACTVCNDVFLFFSSLDVRENIMNNVECAFFFNQTCIAIPFSIHRDRHTAKALF